MSKTKRAQNRYEKKVRAVLQERKFIINTLENQLIRERIRNGRRYFFLVAQRIERGRTVERFIKIPENNTKKLIKPFIRQIEFAKYLSAHRILSTRKVIESNTNPAKGTPFAIFETFPKTSSGIGFIEHDYGSELLSAREAKQILDELEILHRITERSLPKQLRDVLKRTPHTYKTLERRFKKILERRVHPLDRNGARYAFKTVLAERLHEPNFKEKAEELLKQWRAVIMDPKNQRFTIVHGDLSPNNLYVFSSGVVELLDYEWVGYSYNAAIAMIIDYGNMRARAWASPAFRVALDKEILRRYSRKGKAKLGRAIVSIGTLLSHAGLSRAFENYPWEQQLLPREKRRRIATEQDLLKVFKMN